MHNCYNIAVRFLRESKSLNDHDRKEIKLLLGQYYLGTAPKKELHRKLAQLGVIKNEEDGN